MRALACVLAAILLAGCATRPPQVVKLYPPASLLADCAHPDIQTGTNGDLARGILSYRAALDTCNNDKAALREWAKE